FQGCSGIVLAELRIPVIKIGIILRRHASATAPALIPHAPKGDIVRLGMTVLPPQISQGALAIEIEILQPVLHLLRSTCPHIPGYIWLATQQLAKLQKLARAETIVFGYHPPRGIHRLLPLFPGTDAVPPVILVGITPARPPEHGDPDLLQRLDHIHPDMIAGPEAVIDTSAEIFGKMSINISADGRTGSVPDRQGHRRLAKNTRRNSGN